MSEKYISVETAVALAMQYCPDDDGVCSKAGHDLRELLDDLENTAPADVRPVVLCRDCKFSYDSVGGRCCSHGVCVDCIVQDDFFCADGERRKGDADG